VILEMGRNADICAARSRTTAETLNALIIICCL
jgi:hypothetical protein